MRSHAIVLLLAGCGRFGFNDQVGGDASVDAVPDTALHVTITSDRMAGPSTLASIDELPAGTVGLSIREALAIANNHVGPDRVVFDPQVFPTSAPISLVLDSALVVGDTATVLDASTAGVTLVPRAGLAGPLANVTGTDGTVDGLVFQGGDVAISAIGVTGLVIRRVHALDTIGDAFHLDNVANATIEDSRVDRAGPAPIHISASTDSTVQRTFVALAAKTGTVYGVRVEQSSRIHLVDNTVDPGTAWMISLQGTVDSEVIGNVIDGGDSGIVLTGTSDRNLVFRNVVMAPAYDSVYLDATAHDNVVLNNTFFMASNVTDAGLNTSAKNNLVSVTAADFVAPAAYDFHLAAGNPAVDAAADVGQDMLPASAARFLGAGPDLGAVESY